MTRGRWFEIEEDAAAAARHFGNAGRLYERGGFARDGIEGYAAQMAFLHAMQSGHTSLEAALVRVLRLLDEEVPAGADWHADLLRRVAREVEGRPAVLPDALADAAEETRRFRHVAARSYDNFSVPRAEPAVRAAALLARDFPAAVQAFRRVIDPA
jgi:hypothetical protein